MKNIFKSVLSIFMVICMLLSFAVISNAATSSTLLTIYADNMLFEQNEISVIAGKGPAGATISLDLVKNSTSELVYQKSATVNMAGDFEINIQAPAGSYEEYTVNLYENGTLFRSLSNVVFGELWLASGQSNMQLALNVTIEGQDMMNSGRVGSKWIRVLMSQGFTTYDGKTDGTSSAPDPQQDIPDCYWMRADSDAVYNVSAVAYHFAEKLQADLNMPVGILSANVGGSLIATWLSRQTIETDPGLLNVLQTTDQYIALNKWKRDSSQVFTMTANYNMKLYPLRRFRIAGMIWFQGESEIMLYPELNYNILLTALQNDISTTFSYSKGTVPIVLTELPAYPYTYNNQNNSVGVYYRNYDFVRFKNTNPSIRAVTTINDVPLTYNNDFGNIHPLVKKPVGERMAYAAEGLVYKKSNIKGAPELLSYTVEDNSMYLKFNNVGDGLATDGKKLSGFSICGDNKIYVEAEAKIVSKNTVKVWNDKLANPKAVCYKSGALNMSANLYSTLNGKLVMPAETIITDGVIDYTKAWGYADWTNCENATTWHNNITAVCGDYPTWVINDGEISYEKSSAFSGSAGIHLKGPANVNVNLEPNINYISIANNGLTTYKFDDTYKDWSNYTSLSFMVRNNGSNPANFGGLLNMTNIGSFIPYIVNGQVGMGCTIPADGKWHEINMDFEHQIFNGDTSNYGFSSTMENWFDEILRAIFVFSSSSNFDLSIDDFRFTTADCNKDIARTIETEHNMYNWYTITEPTCSSKGSEKRVCQNIDCEYTETREIPVKNHTPVTDKGYAATCTSDGLTDGSHCYYCNAVIKEREVIKSPGHKIGDWNTVTPATCKQAGLHTKTCSVCKQVVESEEIPQLTHIPNSGTVLTKATCTKKGEKAVYCTLCKEFLYNEDIDMLPHSVVTQQAVEPTCTKTGLTEGKTCSVCKLKIVKQEVVPAKGHTEVIDKSVPATCTQSGLTEGKHCSVCNLILKIQITVKAKGHTSGTPVKENEVPSTCSKQGSYDEVVYCTVCKNEVTRTTKALKLAAHTPGEWVVSTPATTTAPGLEVQKCAVCTQVIDSREIPQITEIKITAKEGSGLTIDDTYNMIFGVPEGSVDIDDLIETVNCTVEYEETAEGFGTGTLVKVKDAQTVVKTYKIVVSYDVTGDGYCDAFDVSVLSSVSNYESEFEENSAYFFAGDVAEDGFIDAFDLSQLTAKANYEF